MNPLPSPLADAIKSRRLGHRDTSGRFGDALRLWWVRHGPVPATEGRITGQRDVAVDLSDTATLARLAAALPSDAVILATPLSRTRLTARALFGREPDGIEADLIEQDFGRWSDFRWAEIADEASALGFWDDPVHNRPPGGESMAEHGQRVGRFIARAVAAWPGRDVICVCHSGTIRAGLAHGLGIAELPAPVMTIVIDPLSLSRTDVLPTGGGTVSLVNRTFTS